MTTLRLGLGSLLRRVGDWFRILAKRVDATWRVPEWHAMFEQEHYADEHGQDALLTYRCLCGWEFPVTETWYYGSLGNRHWNAYQPYCSQECALRYKRSEAA